MTWTQDQMCEIAAEMEIQDNMYVNLGIGIPTLVANHIPNDKQIILHSENGMLGMGPFPTKDNADPDLINAGKQTITELPHSSYFDSAASFAMVRGGHIDLTILGALQVSSQGDLANWTIPGKMMKGMGGAMDLVVGAKRVVVIMEHCTKDGQPKITPECTFPLTGKGVVNSIITNLAVFEIEGKETNKSLKMVSKSEGVSMEEIKKKTGCDFTICARVQEK